MVETSQSNNNNPDLAPELVEEALNSFEAVDEEQKGYITDKDHIYALFLSLGVTFDSEEEFLATLSRAIDDEPVEECKQDAESAEESKEGVVDSEEQVANETEEPVTTRYKLTKTLFMELFKE